MSNTPNPEDGCQNQLEMDEIQVDVDEIVKSNTTTGIVPSGEGSGGSGFTSQASYGSPNRGGRVAATAKNTAKNVFNATAAATAQSKTSFNSLFTQFKKDRKEAHTHEAHIAHMSTMEIEGGPDGGIDDGDTKLSVSDPEDHLPSLGKRREDLAAAIDGGHKIGTHDNTAFLQWAIDFTVFEVLPRIEKQCKKEEAEIGGIKAFQQAFLGLSFAVTLSAKWNRDTMFEGGNDGMSNFFSVMVFLALCTCVIGFMAASLAQQRLGSMTAFIENARLELTLEDITDVLYPNGVYELNYVHNRVFKPKSIGHICQFAGMVFLILSVGILMDLFHGLGHFMFVLCIFASVGCATFTYFMSKRNTPFFGAQFELSSVVARRKLEIKDRKILRRLIELRRDLKASGQECAEAPDGHNVHEHHQNRAVYGHHEAPEKTGGMDAGKMGQMAAFTSL